MPDLSTTHVSLEAKDAKAVEEALTRDRDRLTALMKDYQQVRGNTRNPTVKAMADEGNANMRERVAALDALLAKIRAQKP